MGLGQRCVLGPRVPVLHTEGQGTPVMWPGVLGEHFSMEKVNFCDSHQMKQELPLPRAPV